MPRAALGSFVVAVAVALLWRAFANVDIHAAAQAIARIGPLAPVMLVPFALAMTVDAFAIQRLLAALGRAAPLGRLIAIRIGTEALHLTAPAGFAVCDSAAAGLLDSRCGVPVAEGATIAVARRWLVMRAHAGYLALGAVVGWGVLAAVSVRLFGTRSQPWIGLASSLVPLAMSAVVGATFRHGRGVAFLAGAAAQAHWSWLRARAAGWQAAAACLRECMDRVGRARGAVWIATGAFFGCWLLESCDTAIVLRLLGAPPDFALAIAAEVGISLVKSIGNVAPASLGVQDAGYAALLPAMGVPVETAAAFVVVKRAKEVAWIAFGYALLAIQRRAGRPTSTRPPIGGAGPTPVSRFAGEAPASGLRTSS
jgi:hypothetical protein